VSTLDFCLTLLALVYAARVLGHAVDLALEPHRSGPEIAWLGLVGLVVAAIAMVCFHALLLVSTN
jgi:hypothetical protein